MSTTSSILHISNIPIDTLESDLYSFLSNYPIKCLTLIKKSTKKFAKVEFISVEIAEKAKAELNGLHFTSQSGLIRCISWSTYSQVDHSSIKTDYTKNVLVKNISPEMTGREFYLMMSKYGDIKYMKYNIDTNAKSKGYGEVYYYTDEHASTAISDLNTKIVLSRELSVCHLIPGKTNTKLKTNWYIKNFPKEFNEKDINKYFEKYGTITSAVIARDDNWESKCFGFVCFSDPKSAYEALTKEKEIKHVFEGCNESWYINYAMRKDDRLEMKIVKGERKEQLTLFAKIRDDYKFMIKTEDDFIKEIQGCISTILGMEYTPKKIQVNLDEKTAVITMSTTKLLDEFMNKYVDYTAFNLPNVWFNYYQAQGSYLPVTASLSKMNEDLNTNNMFAKFTNLSLFNPNEKPIIIMDGTGNEGYVGKENRYDYRGYNNNSRGKRKNYYQEYQHQRRYYNGYDNRYRYKYNASYYSGYNKKREYQGHFGYRGRNNYERYTCVEVTENKECQTRSKETTWYYDNFDDWADEIYNYILTNYKQYEDKVGKLTGMICDLGIEEMKEWLKNKSNLNQIILTAIEYLAKA